MTRKFPGWLPIAAAARRYGLTYETLRRMVKEDIFTRGRFTSLSATTPPIYLRIEELEAWKTGGVDAVLELRGRVAPANDLGGEAGGA